MHWFEKCFEWVKDLIMWPWDRLGDIRHYTKNRWISKTHVLSSNLKKGQWHEFDERLLHSTFDSLVDFVEIEQAWHNVICRGAKRTNRFRFSKWRNAELGLEYLDWASLLCQDEEWNDKNDPNFGRPTHQALAAQETLKLYTWWKEVRPNRPDPMDASGLTAFYEEREIIAKESGRDFIMSFFDDSESKEDKARKSKYLEICDKMEKDQNEEDTEMLIRLIRLRSDLWA